MSLVQDIVARFRVQTDDYVSKLDAAKAKNKELAQSLLDTAGSADKAIGTLKAAGKVGALGDIGVDKRQVSGIVSEIRSLSKEANAAATSAHHLGDELRDGAREARGYDRLTSSLSAIGRGDLIGGLADFRRGLASIRSSAAEGGPSFGNSVLGLGVTATVIGVVAKGLADVTTKAVKLRQEFLEGSKNAGDIAEELLKSVPILGSIWTAGRNIRELLGLDGAEIKSATELQERMNGLRRELLDILKASNEESKKFSEGTDDVIAHTHVVSLEAHGDDAQAKSAGIAADLVKGVRDTAEQAAKEAQGHIDAINERLAKPDEKAGGRSATQQAADAATAAAKAKSDVLEAERKLADLKASGTQSDEDGNDPVAAAESALADAKTASLEADARAAQTSGVVTQATSERAKVEANLTRTLRERIAAQVDASAADVAKQLGQQDPRALDASAGAARVKAGADAIIAGTQPVEDKVKALDEYLKTTLGADAAKAFAGLDVKGLDGDEKAKRFLDGFKAALDGKAPIADWLNAQLGGDALATLSPTAAIAKAIAAGPSPEVEVRVTPTGDIRTWIRGQSGEVTASVIPKGESVERWLRSQNLTLDTRLIPKGMSVEDYVKKFGAEGVDLTVSPKVPNVTTWLGETLRGNPVSEWLDRQTNKVLKGRSISEWIKAQVEAGRAEWDKLRTEATAFKDGLKSPVEKLRADLDEKAFLVKLHLVGEDDVRKAARKTLDDLTGDENKKAVRELEDKIAEAQELLGRGLVGKDDVGGFLQRKYTDLMAEKRFVEDSLDRPVYSLPDVKNLRTGTLFAPPTRNDEKQLEKLDAIVKELQDLNDAATADNVTLTVVGS